MNKTKTSHLKSINKGYFEHMLGAFKTSFQCLKISAAVFIHGIIPALFVTTASETIRKIYERQNKKAS